MLRDYKLQLSHADLTFDQAQLIPSKGGQSTVMVFKCWAAKGKQVRKLPGHSFHPHKSIYSLSSLSQALRHADKTRIDPALRELTASCLGTDWHETVKEQQSIWMVGPLGARHRSILRALQPLMR